MGPCPAKLIFFKKKHRAQRKKKTEKDLEEEKNPYVLLVKMQISAITEEINLELPQRGGKS